MDRTSLYKLSKKIANAITVIFFIKNLFFVEINLEFSNIERLKGVRNVKINENKNILFIIKNWYAKISIREEMKIHNIIFIISHAVNSQIIFTWVSLNSIKLSHTIKNKRNNVVKKPISIDDSNPENIKAKRLVERLKKVNIDDSERIIP